MEFFLLQLFAFLRPILFIELDMKILGLNLLELGAIILFLLLVMSFLFNAIMTKTIVLSSVDLLILVYIFWCLVIYAIYIDIADLGETAKLIIPPFTYIVVKNVLSSREEYLKVIGLSIYGHTIPVVGSIALIATGQGVQKVSYWTGLARYEGVYAGPHTLSHSMVFLLMMMFVYYVISSRVAEYGKPHMTSFRKFMFFSLVALALVAMASSRVRTTILGLIVFIAIVVYIKNRKLFMVGSGVLLAGAIISAPVVVPILFVDLQKVMEGEWGIEKLGSGRPRIWAGNIQEFSNLSIDRQLAGVGIGNRIGVTEEVFDGDAFRNSHNDFLEIMVQTGIVGLIIYLALLIAIYKKIQRMEEETRFVFKAIFFAVLVMNFSSNSYISRFGLGQMLFFLLTYIEVWSFKEGKKSPIISGEKYV